MGMWVTDFCKCCTLKIGCRNIAIFIMVITAFDIIYYFRKEEMILVTKTDEDFHYPNSEQPINKFVLTVWIALLLSALLLFIATFLDDILLVLPFVIVMGLKVFCFTIMFIAGIGHLLYEGIVIPALLTALMSSLLYAWDIYLFLVVFSYFEMLREFS